MKTKRWGAGWIRRVAMLFACVMSLSFILATHIVPTTDLPGPAEDPPGLPVAAIPAESREFGAQAELREEGEGWLCHILYPVTGLAEADAAILEWAQALLAQARERGGEINAQYNSYLIDESYAGVEEIVFSRTPEERESRISFRTFNIDLRQGRLLRPEQILAESARQELLDAVFGAAAQAGPGPQWHVLLREDGVELLFDGGDSSWRRVPMTRGQLGEAFILGQRPVPPPPAEIDPAKPMVALSFDDGPSEVTLRLLRLLNEYNGRATFFTLGTLAETHGDTLRMIVEQGSELGGHSWDHKDLTKLTEDQIRAQLQRTNDAIYEHTGIVPAFYRPPFGAVNAKLRSVSKEMGQAMIHWSVDTLDWKTRDAGRTEQAVFSALRDGSIVLCHDLYGATGDAMARVIPRLSEMGYQMVTVSELMRYRGHALEPGAVYFDGYAAEALS